jgi:hypothetical protein
VVAAVVFAAAAGWLAASPFRSGQADLSEPAAG